ncbi:MAG: carbohydrate porin [Acetobacter indonesiensis]
MKAGLRREMIFCNSIFWGRLSAFAVFALSASGLVIQAAYAEENSFADKLTGQWGGWRTTLFNQGIDLEINDQNEFWGVPVGGSEPTQTYIGVTTAELSFNLKKLTGLTLGTLSISGVDIRGRPFSNKPLYVFNQVSGIEADDNLRLYEVSYDQKFYHDRLDVRVGKLDLSRDFMGSETAQNFLNASFSWPMLPDNNLYDQGPASPLATPAIRVKYQPSTRWSVLAAVGDDNPIGAGFINEGDPWNQNQDPSGTRFHFGTGALMFLEAQYRRDDVAYPGTFKVGGFGDTGRFPDQTSLEMRHKGNWALYGIADQMLAKFSDTQNLTVFVRATGTGLADRNQIVYAVDAGIVLNALFRRANDSVGLGFGVGAPSGVLARSERRSHEIPQGNEYHLELTYQWQACSWLLIQPDIQGILSPSGGVVDDDGRRVHDEAIFGMHSSVSF